MKQLHVRFGLRGLSGIGGFCAPNQFYTGPENTPAKRNRKHQY